MKKQRHQPQPHPRPAGTFRWHFGGWEIFRVEVTGGGPTVTWGTNWVVDEWDLKREMERAADWLKRFLPSLSHDQRYDLLFSDDSRAR